MTRKEQRAPQICLKPWASRHSWKSCFSPTVLRSPQQRGKKSVVPSGSTWRMSISVGASQRTMVEGFFVFCVSLLEVVRIQKHGEICEVVVWVGVDQDVFKMGYCKLGVVAFFTFFSTDWFWQNTAGASTKTRKEQMAPQICFKPWASRHSWKTWIFPTVIRSQQQRGKKFVVPSGSTWRRQICLSAWQEEMVEGFLVFYAYLFVSVGSCSSSGSLSELGSCHMSRSWPRCV